ncbi:MAG: DUF4307 domain-containing protein [Actinomycetota bacterium]|nr:DUF4307 domain-containing protein [Actinomycetota bacterium]MDA2948886.1 DUF4307 domain-containing protein [Actinomycetota bacterium]
MTESSDGQPPPPARYGRAPMSAPARRRVAALMGVLTVVIALGLAILVYQRFERVAVEGSTAAFTVVDDDTVSITISVTRQDPARPVVCIVRARSYDGAETGRREIVVGPSEAKTVQVTTTVKTYARSVMGDIYGCGTTVPGYLAPA